MRLAARNRKQSTTVAASLMQRRSVPKPLGHLRVRTTSHCCPACWAWDLFAGDHPGKSSGVEERPGHGVVVVPAQRLFRSGVDRQ